jgi:serine/threonine protein phosphatase PrpC
MTFDKDNVPAFMSMLLLTPDLFPPLSASATVELAARSRAPAARHANEDHYIVLRLGRSQEILLTSLPANMTRRFDENAYGMVVADGMGADGELASRLAITALMELAMRYGQWRLRVDEAVAHEISALVHSFYRQIDSAMVYANRSRPDEPLQTTMTATVSAGRDLFLAHVGHSRAYLLRESDLMQLTRDHTRAILREKARQHLIDLTGTASDRHHILTDALGAGTSDPVIDVERLTLADGDLVMVCTNGLTDVIGDYEIAEVLSSKRTVDEQAETLVTRAINSGAHDDVTVLLTRYHLPE